MFFKKKSVASKFEEAQEVLKEYFEEQNSILKEEWDQFYKEKEEWREVKTNRLLAELDKRGWDVNIKS
jgi:ornithine cyclodeaminase/alanine dehydrogenase-like protein (mu-crystallin family)